MMVFPSVPPLVCRILLTRIAASVERDVRDCRLIRLRKCSSPSKHASEPANRQDHLVPILSYLFMPVGIVIIIVVIVVLESSPFCTGAALCQVRYTE